MKNQKGVPESSVGTMYYESSQANMTRTELLNNVKASSMEEEETGIINVSNSNKKKGGAGRSSGE